MWRDSSSGIFRGYPVVVGIFRGYPFSKIHIYRPPIENQNGQNQIHQSLEFVSMKKRDRWTSDSEKSEDETEGPRIDVAKKASTTGSSVPGQGQGNAMVVQQSWHPLINGCRSVDAFERLDRREQCD